MTSATLKGGLLAAAAALALSTGSAFAQDVSACLITKTDTNPFFVKMKEGAQAKAKELGVKLTALAGREEGDNEGQVAAMESCIADGV
jgi:fructose transport system substrate-binding protein